MFPNVDIGTPVANAINWMVIHWDGFFNAVGSVVNSVVGWITSGLSAPSAIVLILILTAIPVALKRWGIAVFALLAFSLVKSMGLWDATLQSLAIVVVAALVAAAVGVPLGILAARGRLTSVVIRPVLDLMQTTPPFVYLIPAVFFFGVGVVPGVVATVVFALAPAVRLTELGIRQVDAEIIEAAHAFGATPRQLLFEVQIPLAMPTIMAGINQVIMLALSMVVVAGMAGANGLGAVVTTAVTQLNIASGIEGGLSVVILAIYLDRLTGALAAPMPSWRRRGAGVGSVNRP